MPRTSAGDKRPVRTRARKPEAKAEIRAHLLAVGRHLFANEEPSSVSVRRIAKEAGYTPSTIYLYFANQHELYATIREQDMEDAVEEIGRKVDEIAPSTDMAERLRLTFRIAIDHWLLYQEHFEMIYAQRSERVDASPTKPILADTPVATKFFDFYEKAVAAYLDQKGRPDVDRSTATSTLIAATHGIVLLVRRTSRWHWPDVKEMADAVVLALMRGWASE